MSVSRSHTATKMSASLCTLVNCTLAVALTSLPAFNLVTGLAGIVYRSALDPRPR